jgi:transcriptional regulator with XRE-family HTH domain
MDKTWFREKLEARDLNQSRVGVLLGLGRSQISKILNGTRELSPQEAADMARILGVPLDDLLRHAGVSVQTTAQNAAPIFGVATANGTIKTKFKGPHKIEPLGSAYSAARAVVLDNESGPLSGWAFFFDTVTRGYSAAVGLLAVVETAALEAKPTKQPRRDRVLVRSHFWGILSHEDSERWRLSPLNGAPTRLIERATVQWAAPVLWVQTNAL